ncbi:DUF192 domain-containing protein [Eudoraea chungangensis]|uniref:DUF192 domain-containing protein n=1 Tax=Eudoraea chungangensis TaxID=1481905 RepID=UPI0023ED9229|nr:DUF192 domain-containing protein [Eudoraea chungangensis]
MRTFWHRYIFLLFGLIVLNGCAEDTKRKVETAAISFTKEGELSLYKANSDSLISQYNIEIAESDYETQTGLMYRDSMKENEAMLFVFSDLAYHSFYMKNTKIPLDILFIDENLKIVSLKENAQPFDETGISSEFPVQYVLEINAGQCKLHNISVGDRIIYTQL